MKFYGIVCSTCDIPSLSVCGRWKGESLLIYWLYSAYFDADGLDYFLMVYVRARRVVVKYQGLGWGLDRVEEAREGIGNK